MVAFAIDMGYICHARTELQRTADCCALAAVAKLPNLDMALCAAQTAAQENRGSCSPELRDADFEVGYWNRYTATFQTAPPTGKSVNAVRVTVRRTTATGNPLKLFFANLIDVRKSDVTSSAIAMYDRGSCGPFIGIDWIDVIGSPIMDSYNSDFGFYDPANAGYRSGICSDGPIKVGGDSLIQGNAMAGKGKTITVANNSTVTGKIGNRRKPLNLAPVDASQAATTNDNHKVPKVRRGNKWVSLVDNQNNFLLNSTDEITLPSGTYYFKDFDVNGQSILNVNGTVRIYLTGDLKRAGGTQVNNLSAIPSDLKIYMTGGKASVTSTNNFHGIIYAPNTQVTVNGSSGYFGVIVGKTLTKGGSAGGHYDESLDMELDEFPKRITLVN